MDYKEITTETGIYRILNTVTKKYYIGSAMNFRRRCGKHLSGLNRNKHENSYLQAAWNKYGSEAFVFEIVEVIPKEELIDNKYLIDVEQIWLDTYMPYLRENGYNLCCSAQSWRGMKHSTETIQKLKNRVTTPESRLKISLAKKGVKNPKLALFQSEEHTFISPDGVQLTFLNLREFCRQNNLEQAAMQRVEKNKQTNHKGWTTPETRQLYLDYIAKYPLPPFYVISPEGVEYEVMSPANFAKEHKLTQACMDKLVRGKQLIHKGWTLKDNG